MTDFIDALVQPEANAAEVVGDVNSIGVQRQRGMVVPCRAASTEEIEEMEAGILAVAAEAIPIPFWDGDAGGTLEPLMRGDFAGLREMGITPEQWEIAVLEDRIEKESES